MGILKTKAMDWNLLYILKLGDGRILSRHGIDAICIYPTYKDMVIHDNPTGLSDNKGGFIRNLASIPNDSKFEESVIFTLDDVTGKAPHIFHIRQG